MAERVFDVAQEFSIYPGGRFRKDGPHSGEELRERLVPLLKEVNQGGGRLVVILDGTMGYGASFLEEAFGGLVRVNGFTVAELTRSLAIKARNSVYAPYKELAERYIREARPHVAA